MQQLQARRLALRQVLQLEALGRTFQAAQGRVDPDDMLELPVGHQFAQQASLAAAEVDNPAGAAGRQHFSDASHAQIVEADRPLQGRFRRVLTVRRIGIVLRLLRRQARDRLAHQPTTTLQGAVDDEVTLRMRLEPASPFGHSFSTSSASTK